MIRNYNGNINRAVLRDLKRMCEENVENEKNLFEALAQKGEAYFVDELCHFTKCHDEMPKVVTLKSETEIKEYLKKDFLERVNSYFSYNKIKEDYLLNDLIEIIKETGRFPEKDEMRQIEKKAEEKRIADLPSGNVVKTKKTTENDIAKEILELAEEIMEARRAVNPKDVVSPMESFAERLWIENEEFEGNIFHAIHYGWKDSRVYSCAIKFKGHKDVSKISIEYCRDGNTIVSAKSFFERELFTSVNKYLIIIHKGICQMAKDEGIEFETEIDYEKILL